MLEFKLPQWTKPQIGCLNKLLQSQDVCKFLTMHHRDEEENNTAYTFQDLLLEKQFSVTYFLILFSMQILNRLTIYCSFLMISLLSSSKPSTSLHLYQTAPQKPFFSLHVNIFKTTQTKISPSILCYISFLSNNIMPN